MMRGKTNCRGHYFVIWYLFDEQETRKFVLVMICRYYFIRLQSLAIVINNRELSLCFDAINHSVKLGFLIFQMSMTIEQLEKRHTNSSVAIRRNVSVDVVLDTHVENREHSDAEATARRKTKL